MKLFYYAAGDVIYREGDRPEKVFIIKDGEVEVSRTSGGERVRLAVLGAGEIFGESGIIQDSPRSTTMTALRDTTIIKVDRDVFLQSFGADNPFLLPLFRMLCARLAAADERLVSGRAANREPALRKETAGIRLHPASDLTENQIGEEGLPIRHLPFVIGRRDHGEHRQAITDHALAIYAGRDQSLDGEHFRIEESEEGVLQVRDCDSKFGTIVNDRYLSRYSFEPTAPLVYGINVLIAGTKESPYRFHLIVERAAASRTSDSKEMAGA
ncbi:MAG: cyclic nucleotide-binding domain-containing protein [Rhodothalassiaceae bacterium]